MLPPLEFWLLSSFPFLFHLKLKQHWFSQLQHRAYLSWYSMWGGLGACLLYIHITFFLFTNSWQSKAVATWVANCERKVICKVNDWSLFQIILQYLSLHQSVTHGSCLCKLSPLNGTIHLLLQATLKHKWSERNYFSHACTSNESVAKCLCKSDLHSPHCFQ